jgi:hypothetical protein
MKCASSGSATVFRLGPYYSLTIRYGRLRRGCQRGTPFPGVYTSVRPPGRGGKWGCLELTDRKLGRILNGQSHDTINPQDPS